MGLKYEPSSEPLHISVTLHTEPQRWTGREGRWRIQEFPLQCKGNLVLINVSLLGRDRWTGREGSWLVYD